MLVAGGLGYENGNYVTVATAERYDPKTGAFSSAGTIEQRFHHDAVLLQDGRVLILGGCRSYTVSCNDVAQLVELFDPASSSWKPASKAFQPRFVPAVALLQDGRVLVAGGFGSTNFTSLELYDPKTDSWSSTVAKLSGSRNRASATTLANGKVVIVGGYDGIAKQYAAAIDVFDPKTGLVTTTTAKLSEPRSMHSASLLPDGRILIVGGVCDTAQQPGCEVAGAELFDPAADTIASGGSPTTNVYYHTTTRLGDGRLLVVGGTTTETLARIFTPQLASWSQTASPLVPRGEHAAALLADGRVLIAGGTAPSGAVLTDAELYTP